MDTVHLFLTLVLFPHLENKGVRLVVNTRHRNYHPNIRPYETLLTDYSTLSHQTQKQ